MRREEAALRAGVKPHTLYMALRKPHIITLRTSLRHAYIGGEAERSLAVLVELRDHSQSDHVRLEAAKYVAALGGIQPAKQSEQPIGLPSGPVLMLDDLRDDEPEVIEADWRDVTPSGTSDSSGDDK